MAIYITGDTHGDQSFMKLSKKYFNEAKAGDKVIITGDWGGIWYNDIETNPKHKRNEDWLLDDFYGVKPYEILAVDGNHENFARLFHEFPEVEIYGGKAYQIRPNIYVLKRGEIFEIEGKKFFVFGGGKSHDERGPAWPNTVGVSWWPEEIPSQEEYDHAMRNLAKHNFRVDYIVSHTCPLHEVPTFMPGVFSRPGYGTDKTEWMLEDFKQIATFSHWFFGHIHVDQSAGRYSCLYNQVYKIPKPDDFERLSNFVYHCYISHPFNVEGRTFNHHA